MRLLHVQSLTLTEFVGSSVPRYVILSHTWDGDEVSFQEMTSAQPATMAKNGYIKIVRACEKAAEHGYSYIWIDTCCIDKTSSAELTEAINSMYSWYRDAHRCYVYLSDLPPQDVYTDSLFKSRWFTRGWTLQELIAPAFVEFYDQSWRSRGLKFDLADQISRATGVHPAALLNSRYISHCSVATKMSWASNRQTTRIEDLAYCLLGLFDVNMALLYGEGQNAFRRLQKEIIKRHSDLTILAWQKRSRTPLISTLLAPTPDLFSQEINISPFFHDPIDFYITNKGMRISSEHELRIVSTDSTYDGTVRNTYVLFLGTRDSSQKSGGICLRKVGPRLFCRDEDFQIIGFGCNEYKEVKRFRVTDYYVICDSTRELNELRSFYRHASLTVPVDTTWTFEERCPELLWDETDHVFLKEDIFDAGLDSKILFAQFSARRENEDMRVIVMCKYDLKGSSDIGICHADALTSQSRYLIFRGRLQYYGMTQEDMVTYGIDLSVFGSSASFRIGLQTVKVAPTIECLGDDAIYRLVLHTSTHENSRL